MEGHFVIVILERVVACFKLLFKNLSEGNEKRQDGPSPGRDWYTGTPQPRSSCATYSTSPL